MFEKHNGQLGPDYQKKDMTQDTLQKCIRLGRGRKYHVSYKSCYVDAAGDHRRYYRYGYASFDPQDRADQEFFEPINQRYDTPFLVNQLALAIAFSFLSKSDRNGKSSPGKAWALGEEKPEEEPMGEGSRFIEPSFALVLCSGPNGLYALAVLATFKNVAILSKAREMFSREFAKERRR